MLWAVDQRGKLTKKGLSEEFPRWLRETAHRKRLSQNDIAWNFPFQVSLDTVQNWYQGKTAPDYRHFIGLCIALGELPPVLQELCGPASS